MEENQILFGERIADNLFKEYYSGEVHKILMTRFTTFDLNKLVFIKVHFQYNLLVVDDFVYAEDES